MFVNQYDDAFLDTLPTMEVPLTVIQSRWANRRALKVNATAKVTKPPIAFSYDVKLPFAQKAYLN